MPHELSLAFALFKLTRKAVSLRRLTLEEVRAILQREIYSDYSPVQLLALAQGELLRRILLILKLNLTANDQRWNADLAKHLAGLEEAEQVFS